MPGRDGHLRRGRRIRPGRRIVTLVRYVFAPLLVALSFLTLLPVGVREPTDAEISRSRGWYPLVGLLYGLLLVGVLTLWQALTDSRIPPFTLLTTALLVVIPAVVNRFLHLDGLMDFCDGMWGGRSTERRLEIMRDSRVGSFGVAGCFCVLLIKFSALSTLTLTGWLAGCLLLYPMVSRWTMTLLLTFFPYGRQKGIGSAFESTKRPWLATGLALLTVAAAAWLFMGPAGVVTLIVTSLSAVLLGWWSARRLGGGLTGDCYGATNEIMEALALVVMLMLLLRPDVAVITGYGGGILSGGPWEIRAGWFSYSAS